MIWQFNRIFGTYPLNLTALRSYIFFCTDNSKFQNLDVTILEKLLFSCFLFIHRRFYCTDGGTVEKFLFVWKNSTRDVNMPLSLSPHSPYERNITIYANYEYWMPHWSVVVVDKKGRIAIWPLFRSTMLDIFFATHGTFISFLCCIIPLKWIQPQLYVVMTAHSKIGSISYFPIRCTILKITLVAKFSLSSFLLLPTNFAEIQWGSIFNGAETLDDFYFTFSPPPIFAPIKN